MLNIKYLIELAFVSGQLYKAVLFIPQLIKLYRIKKADELSLLTFIGFNVIQFLTIAHGIIHHDYLLAGGVALSFIPCAMISCLIIKYRY